MESTQKIQNLYELKKAKTYRNEKIAIKLKAHGS